jgi:hypothetical protein
MKTLILKYIDIFKDLRMTKKIMDQPKRRKFKKVSKKFKDIIFLDNSNFDAYHRKMV